MVKKALDLGINFFDTANCYSYETSEEYLAEAFKNLGGARNKVVIASKVYFNEVHLSSKAIKLEIGVILNRLCTDYLYRYVIHRFDKTTPVVECRQCTEQDG